MMNKKQQVLMLLFLMSFQLFSQSQKVTYKPINFADCDMNGMLIGAEKIPQWNCDSITIVQYMNKNVKDILMANVKSGKIVLCFLINADGKTCCSSFTNMTNCELNPLAFKDAINNMPNWISGKQNGYDAKCLKTLVLDIHNGQFIEK